MVESMLGSTLPKVIGKIQKALSKIFIDFAIKPIKNCFFELFLIIICYFVTSSTYYCLILQYLHDFELKQWKKNLENFSKFSAFIKIFSFQVRQLFTFPAITWLNFDLEPKFFHQNISQGSLLKVSCRYTYVNPSRLGDIAKISGGSN